ncbi:hypothetical protein J2S74_004593 [Evansella vedderi]|uniref:Uncharacterized protein n=1 Tax=Evansella vedderi TaxID=38282 RepID=A0ABU0A0Y1_9BACI|nr:hypothetical protein [Evansella vedderi]MDQ0257147.1 hypothetical protein [Evansella vedderi]
MGKSQYISFAIIVGLVIAVSIFFRDPVEEVSEVVEGDEETLTIIEELEQEVAELHVHIEELNEEFSEYRVTSINEKAALQQDHATVLHEMFHLYEMLVDSEIIMNYYHDGAEMKYKEVGNSEIVYVADYGNSQYNLTVITRGSQYGISLYLYEPSPEDGINWSSGTLNSVSQHGGIITDEEIARVSVKQQSGQQEATIKQMEDVVRVWFASFGDWENRDLTIEAFDKDGYVLWKGGWDEGQYFSGRTDN